MAKQVSNRQLFFVILIITVGFSSMQIAGTLAIAVGTNAWATILLSAAIFSCGAFVACFLGYKYKEKTLFEYSQIIVGKPLAYFITFIYVFYFFSVVTFICRISSELIKEEFLNNTPLAALTAMFLLVSVYAASKDLQNIGRLFEYFGMLIVIGAIFIQGLGFLKGDILNIQPLFDGSKINDTFSAIPQTILYFLGFEIVTIIPFNKKNGLRAISTSIFSVLVAALFFIVIVETTFMVLSVGVTAQDRNPLLASIRMIDLPIFQLFKRIDLLFVLLWVFSIFCTISILLYAATENTRKLLPKINGNLILVVIAFIVFIVTIQPFNSDAFNKLFSDFAMYFGIFPAFIIPLSLLIISWVKKYVEKIY